MTRDNVQTARSQTARTLPRNGGRVPGSSLRHRIKLAIWLAYGAVRGRAVEIEMANDLEQMEFVGLRKP